LNPEVIVVTGDHSTPAQMMSHSWHPLPTIIHSNVCRRDAQTHYCEKACLGGGLGRISSVDLMPLAMANAGKLLKFGA
jgi:2,3-bisphosphoglycerate-independent phosphoglycerate mutase